MADKGMFYLRAFQAIKDRSRCVKFIDGHTRILESIGVKKVTSADDSWMDNPNVYVFVVESCDGEEIYGGGRIHVFSEKFPLPIQGAIRNMDCRIDDLVNREDSLGGVGELCGLWNSRKVAGMGFGSVYLLQAGFAILPQIAVTSLFSLCASYTVSLAQNLGFIVETSLGNNGTFYYPKLDLVATALIARNVHELEACNPVESKRILFLRNNLVSKTAEVYREKEFEIFYDLMIEIDGKLR